VTIPPIDSPHNTHVAAARALLTRKGRSAAGAFLVEGPHAVSEALAATGWQVREIFLTEALAARQPELAQAAAARGVVVRAVTERPLASLRDTVTPQGVVAVVAVASPRLADALGSQPRLVAVLDRAADPGNAGTVIRTADAAGADAVVLTAGSVDVWSGKCVRASAGSVFHLPIAADATIDELRDGLRARGCRLLVTAVDGDQDLDGLIDSGQLAQPTAWVFGNEAHGVGEQLRDVADHVVRVPMYGRAESVNLAAAAAVCLYATARAQRH
jgi:TrmH family RNA methyltransferase